MLKKNSISPHRAIPKSSAEDGYLLIGVLVLVAILLITLAVAAPKVSADLQRDKEDELYHRGLQYARAIRLYYKKFGRYPTTMEQLEKSNEIRFLRKRYTDPVTGKDEWRMIHFGEAKVRATGLFGQPITAGGIGGAAAGGTNGLYSATGDTGIGGSTGSSSAFGSSSSFGSSDTSNTTDPTSGATGMQTGTGVGGGLGGSSNGTAGTAGGLGSGSTGIGGSGQTFGGGGIVGVSSTSTKTSIRQYKKQKHYNEWEFVYDPSQEMNGQGGTGILQQQGNTNINPNQSINSPGGNATTPPTTPTAPQQ